VLSGPESADKLNCRKSALRCVAFQLNTTGNAPATGSGKTLTTLRDLCCTGRFLYGLSGRRCVAHHFTLGLICEKRKQFYRFMTVRGDRLAPYQRLWSAEQINTKQRQLLRLRNSETPLLAMLSSIYACKTAPALGF